MTPSEFENYFDECFKEIFYNIESTDATVMLMGLGQLEMLIQICRTLEVRPKIFETKKFKRFVTLQRETRHWFQVTVHDQFRKNLLSDKELRTH